MFKRFMGFLILATGIWACNKIKVQNPSPLTGAQVINAPASSIRLFNFSGQPLDVKVNNIPLTAFSSATNAQGNQIGLALFPTNVWPSGNDGSPVALPTSLENRQAAMPIIIEPRGQGVYLTGPGYLTSFAIDTTLVDDPTQPKDYYVLGNGTLQVIPRNSVAPANPQNCKIRIYNLGQARDTMNLQGSLTLTYADGTPVNAALSNVAPGTASSYVELPMGAYQFKLYVSNGSTPGSTPDYTRQLSELPAMPDLRNGLPGVQADLTTMVRGFLPGGTYSLVVTPTIFGYDLYGGGSPNFFLINAYRVITEQAAPTNVDWARVQGANAFGAQGISFTVDGMPMGNNISFGTAGDYTVVSKGLHRIEALDASGNSLGEQSLQFNPFDNITAWAYMQNDTPRISFTNVDWTSTLYEAPGGDVVNDGTDGSSNTYSFPYCQQYRFMNFSDVPYVTFTTEGNMINSGLSGNAQNPLQSDTLAYPQSFTNLQPGVPVTYNPFVIFPSSLGLYQLLLKDGGLPYFYLEGLNGNLGLASSNPFPLRAYASQPAQGTQGAQIPGQILSGVPSMPGSSTASGTQIYVNGLLPKTENGLYTIALIGSSTASDPSTQLKMIVIKHNK
jgi:hypothetical protein